MKLPAFMRGKKGKKGDGAAPVAMPPVELVEDRMGAHLRELAPELEAAPVAGCSLRRCDQPADGRELGDGAPVCAQHRLSLEADLAVEAMPRCKAAGCEGDADVSHVEGPKGLELAADGYCVPHRLAVAADAAAEKG